MIFSAVDMGNSSEQMDNQKISCVIHTYNSSIYLRECLLSVAWCDEIVVVDMYSTDDTVAIAHELGAHVYMHENLGIADPARAFGVSKCSYDWILALDSDEIIPPRLASKLRQASSRDDLDVLSISRLNYFFGRELKASGWAYSDDVIPRFFRRGSLVYGAEVHNFIKVDPKAKLDRIVDHATSIVHFNYDDVSHFIRKLNTYTDNEVFSTKYRYKDNPAGKICYHILREIAGRFLLKRGYRDGWIGLYLALAMAFYRATAVAKSNLPVIDAVRESYTKVAKMTLEK